MTTRQQTTQPGWNFVGHEHALDLLRRTLTAQQVRHAYLFTGPDHIGSLPSVLPRPFFAQVAQIPR